MVVEEERLYSSIHAGQIIRVLDLFLMRVSITSSLFLSLPRFSLFFPLICYLFPFFSCFHSLLLCLSPIPLFLSLVFLLFLLFFIFRFPFLFSFLLLCFFISLPFFILFFSVSYFLSSCFSLFSLFLSLFPSLHCQSLIYLFPSLHCPSIISLSISHSFVNSSFILSSTLPSISPLSIFLSHSFFNNSLILSFNLSTLSFSPFPPSLTVHCPYINCLHASAVVHVAFVYMYHHPPPPP